jgi:hypothetical protein
MRKIDSASVSGGTTPIFRDKLKPSKEIEKTEGTDDESKT